ncbi:hypothetical protein CSUI_009218 [Cystoisospora suis]|uniref:Uncharacterized protein n=1 Tax=Cystoisospora suis TaxID=483139 RepID=A0A2C6KKS4_9APIC|nr:hypothetical protein CSUI_009218 [Cystoisospora suis]
MLKRRKTFLSTEDFSLYLVFLRALFFKRKGSVCDTSKRRKRTRRDTERSNERGMSL